MDDEVRSLAVASNGDLFAGGDFVTAGGVLVDGLARWDGTTWNAVGTGFTGVPVAMTVLGNNDLVVAGAMTVGGVSTQLARWDGSTWTAMAVAPSDHVEALLAMPNGDLIVGGYFSVAGGTAANNIARWDGTSWAPLGLGVDGSIRSLAVAANGDVIASGWFATAGGAPAASIARWNGASWSPLGSGFGHEVYRVAVMPNGDVFTSANSTTSPTTGIHRWDGASWSVIATKFATALTVMSNGDLVAGGSWVLITPDNVVNRIARWNGTSWFSMGWPGTGPNNTVNCVAALPNGSVVVGGTFDHVGSLPATRVAMWDGTSWTAMGMGLNKRVLDVAVMPNGDVIAVGAFEMSGSVAVKNIARWDGTSWSQVGQGTAIGTLKTLLVQPNGDLVVGGSFTSIDGVAANSIARWDGVSWSGFGSGMTHVYGAPEVLSLVRLPNGDLVAGGRFIHAGGVFVRNVARWDGTAWAAMGSGLYGMFGFPHVLDLAVRPNGDVVAVGHFDLPRTHVARWNGVWWADMGAMSSPPLRDATQVANLPNGDVVVVGQVDIDSYSLRRWNGSGWSTLAGVDSPVNSMATTSTGALVVGGLFAEIAGAPAQRIIRLQSSCVATVASVGNACPSAGGNNAFVADNLPWLGSTFRATGTGLPVSLVGVVTGFSTVSLPLSAILPVGQAGCELLVSPDLVDFAAVTTGSLETELVIPNTAAMAGWNVYQQLVPIEVDASLHFVAMTSSNALSLVFGTM